MRPKAFCPARRRLAPRMALVASGMLAACCPKPMGEDSHACRDRAIHVNREKPRGVEEETVVVCASYRVRWAPQHDEKWLVHFEASPFSSGARDVRPGEDPGTFVKVPEDTAFKYSITVDQKTYDPQIIIMGGH